MAFRATRILRGALASMFALLLSGCFYIPFPERVVDAGPAGDFRKCFGPGTSDRTLHVGKSTRWDVTMVLGEPELLSADGSSFGYTLGTASGLRMILFLFPANAIAHAYGLRITFGPDGTVSGYDISRMDRDINNQFIGYTGLYRFTVVDLMNQNKPGLYRPSDLSLQIMPTTQPAP